MNLILNQPGLRLGKRKASMDQEQDTHYLPDNLFYLYIEANSSLPQSHLEEKAFFLKQIFDGTCNTMDFALSELSEDQATKVFRSATNQHQQKGIEVSISRRDERIKEVWQAFKIRILESCSEILFQITRKRKKEHQSDADFIQEVLLDPNNKNQINLLQEIFTEINTFLQRKEIKPLKEEHKQRIKKRFDHYLRSRNQHHIESNEVGKGYVVDMTIINQIIQMLEKELSIKFSNQIDLQTLQIILNKLKS